MRSVHDTRVGRCGSMFRWLMIIVITITIVITVIECTIIILIKFRIIIVWIFNNESRRFIQCTGKNRFLFFWFLNDIFPEIKTKKYIDKNILYQKLSQAEKYPPESKCWAEKEVGSHIKSYHHQVDRDAFKMKVLSLLTQMTNTRVRRHNFCTIQTEYQPRHLA